jgi:hypothetical protein
MKKQILSEEFKRMQKLAGIITEGQDIKAIKILNEYLDSDEQKSLVKKAITDYILKNNLGSIKNIQVKQTSTSKDQFSTSTEVTLSTGKLLYFKTTHTDTGELVKIDQVGPFPWSIESIKNIKPIKGTPIPDKIPGVKVSIEDNEIIFSNKSGKFPADIENNGTIKMELFLPEEKDRNYEEFSKGNWEDILGPNHVFVKIANSIPTEVEALGDSIGISFKASDIIK